MFEDQAIFASQEVVVRLRLAEYVKVQRLINRRGTSLPVDVKGVSKGGVLRDIPLASSEIMFVL